MERRLSQKAAQMRQRLFTRTSSSRGRAATMASPAPATSTETEKSTSKSSIRSRSATTPVSSNPTIPASDNIDKSRHYHFTDEPGYYQPATPLISRQEIEEDLEDNIKHSCCLLVESIERGLPIWPSFHNDNNMQPNLAKAPHETRTNYQDQMTQLSLSPVALDNLLIPQSDYTSTTHWDSVRPTPYSPPSKYGQPAQNSFASAGTGRFYGRRLSTSPEAQIDEMEEQDYDLDVSRARGRSFGTDTTSPRSRSRSRSSSPGFFPYSPPQMDTAWGRDTTQILEPEEQLFAGDAFLGAEGITWLRASLDQSDRPWPTSTAAQAKESESDRGCMTSTLGTGTGPCPGSGPAPRRFYSTRRSNLNLGKPQWDAVEVHGSRESGLYRGLSMRDLSMDEERKRAHEFSYPVWMGDSDGDGDVLGEQQTFYNMDEIPARHRRKRASELLKKLTGLGMKRKDDLERRAVEIV
ncbi:hypothetical protein N7478_002926 [Penicillium angulare]|uniref:uncharacterized protein n=1 Tax=Penicillium angulare TaxID=116970 RepID=UPI002541F49F|nr:uncharacterized protein N7478_002926 [Penicillium angulare]KAJ5287240.1 hypothetical protein N7478_002926 [Penicillium angulare]